MKTSIGAICLILAAGFTSDALAQYAPISAKIKITVSAPKPDGTLRTLVTHGGFYYRSANGDEMTTHFPVDEDGNKLRPGQSNYFNATSGKIYKIDHALRQATVRQTLSQDQLSTIANRDYPPSHLVVGEKMVNGIFCTGVKIQKGDGTYRGVNWHAMDLDVSIRTESDLGSGRQQIRELYDIQFTEPNGDELGVPSAYSIVP